MNIKETQKEKILLWKSLEEKEMNYGPLLIRINIRILRVQNKKKRKQRKEDLIKKLRCKT